MYRSPGKDSSSSAKLPSLYRCRVKIRKNLSLSEQAAGQHPRIVRDLPISGQPYYLRFVRHRFFCSHCNRPFSELLDFVRDRRDYTNRYQRWIFQQVKANHITV